MRRFPSRQTPKPAGNFKVGLQLPPLTATVPCVEPECQCGSLAVAWHPKSFDDPTRLEKTYSLSAPDDVLGFVLWGDLCPETFFGVADADIPSIQTFGPTAYFIPPATAAALTIGDYFVSVQVTCADVMTPFELALTVTA